MNFTKKNILTIDCEDFLSLPAFKKIDATGDWDKLINDQVELILKALRKANDTKATFFIVGEIAKRNPKLIESIEKYGHHIGSHSNTHRPVYELSRTEFENDLRNSIKNLNNSLNSNVDCFRAPMWSYKRSLNWYWDILKKNNIKYDSSIFPINKYLYGDPRASRQINVKPLGIIELPPSTFRILGLNIPFCGGIYFRILPYWIIKYFIKKLSNKYDHPIIMYFHPWELDPMLLKTKKISIFYRFVLYYNTKGSLRKFNKLVNEFEFTSIKQYFNN